MIYLLSGNLMLYPEFSKYKKEIDRENPLVNFYLDEDGNSFYVEPGFYDGLIGFKEKRSESFDLIMNEIDKVIKSNHKVIFTADFESPWIEREGYIYREISDITDPLRIFVEDKSRGSDYGD